MFLTIDDYNYMFIDNISQLLHRFYISISQCFSSMLKYIFGYIKKFYFPDLT